MWFKAILDLLGVGGRVLERKADLKAAQIEARANATRMASQSEANWEAFAAQNAATSWLDEWWTFVLSMPLIASFIPAFVPFVQDGFQALENVPVWYVWAVCASIGFAFARKRVPPIKSWWRKD